MKIRNTTFKLWLLLKLLMVCTICNGQKVDTSYYSPDKLYLYVNETFGDINRTPGLCVGINVLYQGKYQTTFQATIAEEYLDDSSRVSKTREYALLFGRKLNNGRCSSLFLTSGVTVVDFIDHTYPALGYDERRRKSVFANYQSTRTLGVPIFLKYMWSPVKWFGFAADAGANFNLERTYFTFRWGVVFGFIREAPGKHR